MREKMRTRRLKVCIMALFLAQQGFQVKEVIFFILCRLVTFETLFAIPIIENLNY